MRLPSKRRGSRDRISGRWRRLALGSVLLVLVSCSDTSAPSEPAAVATPVDPTTAGIITVVVGYGGTVPTPKVLNMRSAPQCAEAHTVPVFDQSLVVQDGHLSNAVVWIKAGLEGWRFAPPHAAVVIDQKGCIYEPHVAVAMVGQPVEFVNSDPEPHNVHGQPKVISAWNFLLSRQGATRKLTFDRPEIAVAVGCDIHPWMRAYLAVVPNPYAGVSGPDGKVVLRDVPPGDYTLGVWHEQLGTQEQKVSLPPKGTQELRFNFGS
jgi:plastocyanin